jgi:mitochondrial fission protein ELM1
MTRAGAPPTCWVVTDGKPGMESQCLGLAEALGTAPIVKRVALRTPWRQLLPYLRLGQANAFSAKGAALAPPWPDLLIASGRQSVAASLHVRAESRRAGQRTITVQIQDPVISPAHFDLVIVPEHDRLKGANVVTVLGALHRVTPDTLAREADTFAPCVAHLPRPYLGVLIGGANAAYRFGEGEMATLAAALRSAIEARGGSLLVTPSRRTGEANARVLREALEGVPAFIWEGEGANPYFGILGLSDTLVVTCDSVNMVSEAVAAAKPVYVFDLPGGSPKFARFHEAMRARGWTRAFTGALGDHAPAPKSDDMARAAEAVKALLS